MAERTTPVRRLPLARTTSSVTANSATVRIRPLEAEGRLVLRLRERDLAANAKAGGLKLDMPINTFVREGDRTAARLGPGEWLLIAPEVAARDLTDAITRDLGGTHHALVEVSHRQCAIEVAGEAAADVINAGCPLDLSRARFPTGTATRTVLNKSEIILMRTGDEPRFRIEVWRSFAPYVHAILAEAAMEFVEG